MLTFGVSSLLFEALAIPLSYSFRILLYSIICLRGIVSVRLLVAFNEAVSNSIYRRIIGCRWIMNWKGCVRERFWPNFRYSSGIFRERVRKSRNNFIQNSLCLGRDSNRTSPEFISEKLPLEPTFYVFVIFVTVIFIVISIFSVLHWLFSNTLSKYHGKLLSIYKPQFRLWCCM
jgi:hypothetical protein